MMEYVSTKGTSCIFFFFNDTATTEIYTLSLHDALPICDLAGEPDLVRHDEHRAALFRQRLHHAQHLADQFGVRSEEHTSELQSRQYLVCRLLLEKKNTPITHPFSRFPPLYTSTSHICRC